MPILGQRRELVAQGTETVALLTQQATIDSGIELDDLAEELPTSPAAPEYVLEPAQAEETFSEGFLDLDYPPPDMAPPQPSDDSAGADLGAKTHTVAEPAVAQPEESVAQQAVDLAPHLAQAFVKQGGKR